MSKIVAFKDSIPPGEVNEDMVATLESLLARAKSGDLRGFAYATFSIGDITGTGWEGSDGSRHPLSSAISILQQRYTRALMEGD